ncbi:RNA-guided endonuclease InsQ/TnpB family protein [Nitrosopumilus sp.]|uniref:RNA-guided endonuclease InsQ/TnpB family protein n=1 Tax=Nitrosopumilus sp. TaxID=2024843 RepID=UPI0034A02A00
MKQTKCVWQFHDKSDALKEVFDYFRFCTNEMIRVSEQKNLTSRGAMHKEFYKNLREDFIAKYIQSSTSVAKARLKLYRTTKKKKPDAKIPYVKRNMITLDNQSFKIQDEILRIPIKPHEYIFIKLHSYVIKKLEDTKVGSITLTPEKLIISYSKEVFQINPKHHVGIDRNFDNATSFDTTGKFMVYNLKKTNQIKATYKVVKSKFKRNDARIRKKLYSKYGKKEKNRVHQLIHEVSKKIVSQNQGIVLEDLKGIRKLYRKGNGQGKKTRGKMNSWSFYELQRQIEYKALWSGLPVQYVKANGTSSKCSECGSKLVPEENRMMICNSCKTIVDRDINASRNILNRGMRFVPHAVQSEVMKQFKDTEQIVPSLIDGLK